MSESKRASTMTWMWPLIVSMLLPSFLNLYGYAQQTFLSVDLMIVGGGVFASGLLLRYVALPRTAAMAVEDHDRTIAWHRALVVPYILLGALIGGLGAALMVVPSDTRSVDSTWVSFCILMLIDLGVIMARTIRIFSVDSKKE